MAQEIDEMLANSLSLEDEEAVQAELRELQLETVRPTHYVLPTNSSQLGITARRERRRTTSRAPFCTNGATSQPRQGYVGICFRCFIADADTMAEPQSQNQERERVPVAA